MSHGSVNVTQILVNRADSQTHPPGEIKAVTGDTTRSVPSEGQWGSDQSLGTQALFFPQQLDNRDPKACADPFTC